MPASFRPEEPARLSFRTPPSSRTRIHRPGWSCASAARWPSRTPGFGCFRRRPPWPPRAVGSPGDRSVHHDRAAVRPVLYAGSADAPGLRRAGHRRPALRSRDRRGALPPQRAEPDCDILYYGKWTPYLKDLLSALAQRFRVRVHAYAGETRWSVREHPPLDTRTPCAPHSTARASPWRPPSSTTSRGSIAARFASRPALSSRHRAACLR